MNVEVEFTFDLDSSDPDWPEVESCQLLITEDELPLLHKDILRRLRITPRALKEVFAEARELTKEIKPGDRVRIVADRGWRGEHYRGRSKDDFVVAPVRYSVLSDPELDADLEHVEDIADAWDEVDATPTRRNDTNA